MKKKNLIRLGLTGIVLAASLLLLSSDKPVKTPAPVKEMKTCCKKMQVGCPIKSESTAPSEIILENLSQQFISITTSFY